MNIQSNHMEHNIKVGKKDYSEEKFMNQQKKYWVKFLKIWIKHF